MMLGPVEIVAEVDSTNRVLMDRARAGAAHGCVLVADHQTAGRGRLDRRWEAAPGTSLLVSVLLRPALRASDLHNVTAAAAIAAVDTSRALGGDEVAIKWPNDLVWRDRKLAGLLAEAILEADRVLAVVLGMGLNLRWRSVVPAEGVDLATVLGRVVPRDEVLAGWLERLETWLAAPAADVDAAYRVRCSTLGRDVAIETPEGRVQARAVDVDERGCLVTQDGTAYAVGDVVHVRPAPT